MTFQQQILSEKRRKLSLRYHVCYRNVTITTTTKTNFILLLIKLIIIFIFFILLFMRLIVTLRYHARYRYDIFLLPAGYE
jgi:hypothetical protein